MSSRAIADALAKNLKDHTCHKSKSGIPLFFQKEYISNQFMNLFGITKNQERFYKAFQIVTGGIGNEINKINSVDSSALLSLLCFFPLFRGGSNTLKITIPEFGEEGFDIGFDECLFEVRNKVIYKPSCVDVVLYSKDKSILLFLESKLSEYSEDIVESKEYGKGYLTLYEKYLSPILSDCGFQVGEHNGKTKLSYKNESCYIEGVKQSISHLIGIIRGPKDEIDEIYNDEYLNHYKELFHSAKHLVYGTILYDPTKLSIDNTSFNSYQSVYNKTIGANGNQLITNIRAWIEDKNSKSWSLEHLVGKDIHVLPEVLTYQKLFDKKDNLDNRELLSSKVMEYYNL